MNTDKSNLETAIDLLGEKGLAKPEGRGALQDIVYLLQRINGKKEYNFQWHDNRPEAV